MNICETTRHNLQHTHAQTHGNFVDGQLTWHTHTFKFRFEVSLADFVVLVLLMKSSSINIEIHLWNNTIWKHAVPIINHTIGKLTYLRYSQTFRKVTLQALKQQRMISYTLHKTLRYSTCYKSILSDESIRFDAHFAYMIVILATKELQMNVWRFILYFMWITACFLVLNWALLVGHVPASFCVRSILAMGKQCKNHGNAKLNPWIIVLNM